MKRNQYLHRIIALVMSAVMLLSLATIDNRFGTTAKDEFTKEVIDLEDYVSKSVKYKETKDGEVDVDSVKETEVAVPLESAVTFKGDYLMETLDAEEKDQTVATSCDAAEKEAPKKASKVKKIKVESEEDVYRFAVYKAADEEDAYEFAGVIKVFGAGDADVPEVPTPTITASVTTGDALIDKGTYYYAKPDTSVEFQLDVTDGTDSSYTKQTPEDPTDITLVTYSVDGGNEIEVTADGTGAYSVTSAEAGTYTFTVYNRGGKAASDTKSLKYPSTIKIEDITVDTKNGSVLKEPGIGTMAEFYNKQADAIDVTVTAKEIIAGNISVPLKLQYCFVNGMTAGSWNTVEMTEDAANENYHQTVTIPKASSVQTDYKVIFRVADAAYPDDLRTYMFDENGSLVFIDNDAPDIAVGTFDVYQGADKVGAYSDLSGYTYNDAVWFNKVDLKNVTASENYSPIDAVSVKDGSTTLLTETNISKVENTYTYAYTDIEDADLSDGKHTITWSATNRLGEIGTKSVSFNLDKTGPVISVQSAAKATEVKDNEVYAVADAKGETLSVSVEDALSGVYLTTASVNNAEVDISNNKIELATAGVYEVEIVAKDNAGNESVKTFTVQINNDILTDTLSVTSDGQTVDAESKDLVYTGGDKVVVKYQVTGLDLDAKDITITSTVTGKAGNAAATSVIPDDVFVTPGNGTGVNKTVTLIYALQGAEDEGIYSFKFETKHHYIENDTNTTVKSFQLAYDTTAPSVTTMEFTNAKAQIDGVYYYASYPTIKIEAEDAFALNSYKITDSDGNVIVSGTVEDAGKKLEHTFTLTKGIAANKIYTIRFYIDDKAGNPTTKSEYQTKSGASLAYKFAMDTEKPTVGIDNMTTDGSLKLQTYWNQSGVTVSAKATDNFYITSYRAEAVCDGKALTAQTKKVDASPNQSSAAFNYTQAGSYEVTVYAIDEAGNEKASKCRFIIDKKGADISFSGIPKSGIYRNDGNHPITITVSDDYGIQAGNVTITEYYETYDGTKGQKTIASANSNSKTTKATVTSCEVVGDKPMKYYFVVSTKDDSGNVSNKTSSTFYFDEMNPDLTMNPDITVEEDDYYYNDKVTFTVDVEDQFALGTVVYLLDSDDYYSATGISSYEKNAIKTVELGSAYKKTFNISASKAGNYDWTLVAVDASGNENAITDIQFTIDKERPEAEIDGVPEDGLSTGTTVTITITDNEALDKNDFTVIKHYKYYNDTEYKEKKVTVKQASDTELTAATDCEEVNGKACSYYFTVSGTDKAGNKVVYDTDSSKFKVDETVPAIDVTPEMVIDDDYFNKGVKFKINVKEQFAKKHTVTISDKNKSVNKDEDEVLTFNGTEGTFNVSRSKEGKYNLKITAEDAFGNPAEATIGFVIDKTKPTIGIATVNKLNNGNVTLNVTIADNYKGKEYVTHVIRKNASGTVVEDKEYTESEWKNTSAGPSYVFTEEGDYEVSISAKDKAGNRQIAENVTFRIDKTAPVLSITGVADSQTTDCTATLSVNETFPFSYDGSSLGSTDITATITKKTDGAGASTVATLNTGNFSGGNPHTATYSFSEDGEYTITFSARDMVGNTAATVTKTFKVDKTAPELTVSAVNSKNAAVGEYEIVGGDADTSKDYVDMNIAVKETFFATNKVTIAVKKDGKDVSSGYFQNFSSNAEVSRGSQRFEEDGVYTIDITAEDALGNKAESYSTVFTVDNTPPTVESTSKMSGFAGRRTENGDLLLNGQDFADIKDKGYDALWTVNDTSVFTADVKLDGIDFVDFSDMTDGHHTMTITVTDEVGHVTSDTFDFTYDGTAPRIIITGVDDKSVVRNPFTMSISLEDPEDIITEIVINGNTIDPALYKDTNTYEVPVEEYGKYEVKVSAADTAGNVASTYDSETGEVFSFHLRQKVSLVIIILIIVIVLILAVVLLLILLKKRKKQQN